MTVMESTNPGVSQERGPPGGISIDRLIGKKIGAKDAFSSTVSGRGICVSADGPGQSVPTHLQPRHGVQHLLRAARSPRRAMPGTRRRRRSRATSTGTRASWTRFAPTSNRMNARLAGPERAKLEQYLESLRTLEEQIGRRAQTQGGCMKPASPAEGALDVNINVATSTWCSPPSVRPDPRQPHRLRGHGGAAGHLQLAGRHAEPPRRPPRQRHGHGAEDLHLVVRAHRPDVDRWRPRPRATAPCWTTAWWCSSTPAAASHHRGYNNHPMIFWGGAGGQLKTGRYLTYPEGSHCMSDAYVSIGNMFGLELDQVRRPRPLQGPAAGTGVDEVACPERY